jgi:inhibitor of KinA
MIIIRIYAIHDQALTIELGNEINESINLDVINLKNDFEEKPFDGFIECVPAYSSLTIYFDISSTQEAIRNEIISRLEKIKSTNNQSEQKVNILDSSINTKPIIIPVCYDVEYGTDLSWLSEHLNLEIDEIISLHTQTIFRVYMMGFIPGFAYMGTLPDKLQAPRKQTPTQQIPIGSVAIAGKQTGIYPAAVPGGWQIIGRTPYMMFDKKRDPFSLLKAGDSVQFKSISKKEFESAS